MGPRCCCGSVCVTATTGRLGDAPVPVIVCVVVVFVRMGCGGVLICVGVFIIVDETCREITTSSAAAAAGCPSVASLN
eukprot:scaffold213285_cov50-Attheya_sp.AAC.3